MEVLLWVNLLLLIMNLNYSLVSPDTTHLSERGSTQVNDFIEFVKTQFDDIKKGEFAKQKVARYYLEQENLTDGADKVITGINEALGISKGYLSKIRTAGKFINSLGNDIHSQKVKSFVEEHPVSTQYYMTKMDVEDITDKMKSGERFSFREAQEFPRGNQPEIVVTEVTPAPEPVQSELEKEREILKQKIDDESLEFITSFGSAKAYLAGSTADVVRAAIQRVMEIECGSQQMESMLRHLADVCNTASAKSARFREEAVRKTSIINHKVSN